MSAEGYRSLEARSSGAMYLQADTEKNAEENQRYVKRESGEELDNLQKGQGGR